MSKPRAYPAKLLLFGEHAVLLGGEALALPLAHYQASWSKLSPHDNALQQFLDWLPQQEFTFLELSRLKAGLPDHSLSLASNIPQGYGLGSSGSVTAAIYDWLVREPSVNEMELKQRLASMESFFHGNSSGTDPLVSYLNRPVWLNHSEYPEFPALPLNGLNHWYLVDSGQPRSAGTTIQRFLSTFRDGSGLERVRNQLLEINAEAIRCFVTGEEGQLEEVLQRLSFWQWEHMHYMIPESLTALWQQGLEQGTWFIKICGAGGGGFLLLWSHTPPTNYPLIPLKN